jgi:LysR family glycine cleavage system transcriptional activator
MKPRSKISLNSLRTFEATARHKSMTSAAHELLVTPGAVSRQISELQAVLSFDLFEGPPNARQTSLEGTHLAQTLTKALDEIDATLRRLDPARDRLLDVACISTSAVRWLIPRLYRFREIHPEIDLRLSTDPRRPDKNVNRLDVSIMVLKPNEPLEKFDTVLFPETLGPVLRPSSIETADIVAVEDLFQLLHVTTKTRPDVWRDWEASLEDQSIASEFDHLSIAIEAALNGLEYCISPQHLVEADIANGRLVAPFGFKPSGFTYIMRPHGRRKAKVDAFVSWLSEDIIVSG